jgi:hypothetical protein
MDDIDIDIDLFFVSARTNKRHHHHADNSVTGDADNSVANPNLVVTFSDSDSSDDTDKNLELYRKEDTLPLPEWWMALEGFQGFSNCLSK